MIRLPILISLLLTLPQFAVPAFGSAQEASTTAPAQAGGVIHGSVKSGSTPLPGVSITATNTLSGKKYSTATDGRGSYSMTIPQNGRYVVKTELAAFAASTQEALLNATGHDRQVDFTLVLASRAVQQPEPATETAQTPRSPGAGQAGGQTGTRQYSGRGAQNLSLMSSAADLIGAASGGASSDSTQLPSLANNSDVSGESVAVAGQTGSTNPFAGLNPGDLRGDGLGGPGDNGPGGPGGAGGPGGGGPGGGGF